MAGVRGTPKILIVLVTCPTRAVAKRLARALIDQRLAACVNIIPAVESVYVWRQKVESAKEVLLVIKTIPKRFPSLQRFVRAHHPYHIPEIIALPILDGHPPYLRWVAESVAPQ